jgi:hypothetical protein
MSLEVTADVTTLSDTPTASWRVSQDSFVQPIADAIVTAETCVRRRARS